MPPSPPPPTIHLTVLISGNGSNLQALIDATTSTPTLLPDTRITHVISNRKAAHGLTRAAVAGLPTTYHPLAPYRVTHRGADARRAYDADLAGLILCPANAEAPDIVVCAGWMHVLSSAFLAPLEEAGIVVLNLHPALPGEFVGVTDAIRRAWEEGRQGRRKRTGVMVHRLVEQVDAGETVLVGQVDVREEEGWEEFETRVHQVEWRVVVDAVRLVGEEVRERKKKKRVGMDGLDAVS